jgi:hypothetical protein
MDCRIKSGNDDVVIASASEAIQSQRPFWIVSSLRSSQ